MDEEDIADVEETRKIQTSESFAGFGSTEREISQRGAFVDILKTAGDTMGIRLLRKMGWRDGQGIGPKVRRKARFGKDANQGGLQDEPMHLYAPENSQMTSLVRKNDHKGLGYVTEGRLGEQAIHGKDEEYRLSVSDHHHDVDDDGPLSLTLRGKKKPPRQKGGFGVGILNDTGSDEEDPYHMGPQISYNRVISRDKKKKKVVDGGRPSVALSNPLLRTKPIFVSKKAVNSKATSGFRRCHDGRLPLDGFILSASSDSSTSAIQGDKFPLPTVPRDWKSSKSPSSAGLSHENPNYQPLASMARASTLNPTSRASVLGEKPLPGKSVFDYLSTSARSRIANATNNSNLPAALNEAPPPGYTPKAPTDIASLIPNLEPSIAAKALGRGTAGWMPYAEDPSKRTRYCSFLSYRAGLSNAPLPSPLPGNSISDWLVELQEFAHAAQIFKPMSGAMASRFTTSSNQSPKASNVPPDNPPGSDSPVLLSHPQPKSNPAEEAARLGMYGPLTRSTTQFFPTRLLCKRFNVRPPSHVQLDPSDVSSASPCTAKATSSTNYSEATSDSRFNSGGFQSSVQSKRLELIGEKEMEELRRIGGVGLDRGEEMRGAKEEIKVDPERNEAIEGERPGMAVFRAIFGSDSEGEGDESSLGAKGGSSIPSV